jgi:hypothetical protein
MPPNEGSPNLPKTSCEPLSVRIEYPASIICPWMKPFTAACEARTVAAALIKARRGLPIHRGYPQAGPNEG